MTLLLLHATTLAMFVYGVQSAISTSFIQTDMCDLKASISRDCSMELGRVRDVLYCSRLCWSDRDCVGASLDAQGRCLHHHLCLFSVPCSEGPYARRHRYMEPYCLHGTWDGPARSCICRYGTFGERCNKYHSFCDDLIKAGHSNGKHIVILDPFKTGKDLIKVKCTLILKTYSTNILSFRNSGEGHFNRTWNEYVNGFWIDQNNFWIGLNAWHILGKAGLRVVVYNVHLYPSSKAMRRYENFKVANAARGFSLTIDGESSSSTGGTVPDGVNAGDCMSSLQNVSFSTWDRQPDVSEGENCASLAGSGWWFKDGCDIPCHILGRGLDSYETTPPRQRLTFLGTGVDSDPASIRSVSAYIM